MCGEGLALRGGLGQWRDSGHKCGQKADPYSLLFSCHSPWVASYKQAFGAGDITAAKLCAPPAASPMLSSPPLPALSGHTAWIHVHPSGEAPPSNSPLHPAPGQRE